MPTWSPSTNRPSTAAGSASSTVPDNRSSIALFTAGSDWAAHKTLLASSVTASTVAAFPPRPADTEASPACAKATSRRGDHDFCSAHRIEHGTGRHPLNWRSADRVIVASDHHHGIGTKARRVPQGGGLERPEDTARRQHGPQQRRAAQSGRYHILQPGPSQRVPRRSPRGERVRHEELSGPPPR